MVFGEEDELTTSPFLSLIGATAEKNKKSTHLSETWNAIHELEIRQSG